MTSAPPPDSHPTGPPSGPLSGPSSGPSSGPVSEPTRAGGPPTEVDRPRGPGGGGPGDGGGGGGGGGGGAGGPGGGVPWWRSAPRVAIVAAALVAAVVVIVVLTRPGGGAGEVVLQPAAANGRDPFTRSSATESSPPPSPSASPGTPSGATTGVPNYRGSEPGLYGGSRNAASCDVEQQISFLEADRAKALAFAGTEGIDVGAVPSFLRSLTPVQLRKDTLATNHGFRDGKATAFQSVLQAGSAVLIDSRGLPRVRCACGNPLAEPEPLSSEAKTSGTAWPGYRAANTVAVSRATTEMRSFVLYDPETNQYFDRPRGTEGGSDTWAPSPGPTTGSPSPSQSPGSETPSNPSTSESSPSAPETTGTTSGTGSETPTTPSPQETGGESGQSS